MKSNSNCSIIIVNWNSWEDTIECLSSVFCMTAKPECIAIVDNASTDNSCEKIISWLKNELVAKIEKYQQDVIYAPSAPSNTTFRLITTEFQGKIELPDVLLIKSDKNLGFAGGNNLALKVLSSCDQINYHWLLNADTVVKPNALEKLIEKARSDFKIGMVGSSLIYYWDPEKIQAFGGAKFDPKTGVAMHIGIGEKYTSIPSNASCKSIDAEIDYIVGASMLISKEFLQEIGCMCEDYFLYYEEIDWAIRAKDKFKMSYAPDSHVYHKVGGASRKKSSRNSLKYLYKNRLVFTSKFYPEFLLKTKMSMIFQLFNNMRHKNWDDVSAIYYALKQSI